MKRRDLLLGLGGAAAGLLFGQACRSTPADAPARPSPRAQVTRTTPDMRPDMAPVASVTPDLGAPTKPKIALVKTSDRVEGIKRAIALFGVGALADRSVFLKPNFNSSDSTPGSTHEETLVTLIEQMKELGAGPMTIGDRSGMGDTREVMEHKRIFGLAKKHGLDAIVFDELKRSQWRKMAPVGSQWRDGFYMPEPFMNADFKLLTCCLKTHRYGGHFTMALKNSVGLAARKLPGSSYNYMHELHRSPIQRELIAELNLAYQPDLIVLDAVEAFVDGGPAEGDRSRADMILVGTDRVALDALGVAMLRKLGTNDDVSRGDVFSLDQIDRAVALGVGAASADAFEVVTDDEPSRVLADELLAMLRS